MARPLVIALMVIVSWLIRAFITSKDRRGCGEGKRISPRLPFTTLALWLVRNGYKYEQEYKTNKT